LPLFLTTNPDQWQLSQPEEFFFLIVFLSIL
jgi:hypothetical protein